MGMTRLNAITFLGGALSQQLTEAGLTATDDPANLGSVIDDALLTLGVSNAALATAEVADADARGYRVLLRYYGLTRILDAVLDRVDVTMSDPQISKRRSQMVDALQKRIEALKDEAANYGAVIGPSWQLPVSIDLDFLEPNLTTVGD